MNQKSVKNDLRHLVDCEKIADAPQVTDTKLPGEEDTRIEPTRIRTDLDTQIRVALNEDVVKEYAEAMEAGASFPAILVYYDESNDTYILADGFHRLAAHMRVKPNERIRAMIRFGTVGDARWASIGANMTHGLQRTNADKQNAVRQALLHPEGLKRSNRQIAVYVGVDHKTVGTMRHELELSGEIPRMDGRYVQRGNQTYWQNSVERKDIPAGSTCGDCRHFDEGSCRCGVESPTSSREGCDDWEAWDQRTVSEAGASADGPKAKRRKRNPNQYRHLKGCETLFLPVDNPQLFAVELRNYFPTEYLFDCMKALNDLLNDKGD